MSLLPSTPVTADNLLHEVALLRQKGCRLVTLTCLDTGTAHEIIYHFDKGYEMNHLRLPLAYGQRLVSICSLYPAAMIVENEIKDHFGVAFDGLSVDFQGRLILSENAPKTPMNKRCGMEIDARMLPPVGAAAAVPVTTASGGAA